MILPRSARPHGFEGTATSTFTDVIAAPTNLIRCGQSDHSPYCHEMRCHCSLRLSRPDETSPWIPGADVQRPAIRIDDVCTSPVSLHLILGIAEKPACLLHDSKTQFVITGNPSRNLYVAYMHIRIPQACASLAQPGFAHMADRTWEAHGDYQWPAP